MDLYLEVPSGSTMGKNLVEVLTIAYRKLDNLPREDLVIVLGQTGDGKSTMLASLLYGPQNLCETKIVEKKVIEVWKDGKQVLKDGLPVTKAKKQTRTVIDYTKEFKQNSDNIVFKIGHSNS